MILIEAGADTEKAFASKVMLAARLAARGHAAVVDAATMPDAQDRNLRYEAAPYLIDMADASVTQVVLICDEQIGMGPLGVLRDYGLAPSVPVTVIGHFPDAQSRIGAQNQVAYAMGREPAMIDRDRPGQTPLCAGALMPMLAVPLPKGRRASGPVPQLLLHLPPEMIDDPSVLPVLAALDRVPDFRLALILTGKCKETVKASRYWSLQVYGYSELTPASFASLADIAVFFGDGVPGERMALAALDMMRAGRPVVDCTGNAVLVGAGAPALRGPDELTALLRYLQQTVLVNRDEIGRQIAQSPWLQRHRIERLEDALGLPRIDAADDAPRPAPRKLFVPTNGNGLGHAQRCTLIAAASVSAATNGPSPSESVFAAFPSCVPLIRSRGFRCLPLVQKSDDHPDEHANDLLNYLRLNQTLRTGDTLVFDGGYVFDSIFRVILDKGLHGVWVRRGLWRAGQANHLALDREKVFQRVIVPQEAFEELNTDYSHGQHLSHVGPVVQEAVGMAPDQVRSGLADTFQIPIERLIVTMLGGGVAADRSAQIQSLCNLAERRSDCLHLVVVWPSSRVAPGLQGWRNTRLVQTHNALALAAAADVVISAAGYNSFHESLYHRIPTIFVPQTGAFMDDQERRAAAAAERGLALSVGAMELLSLARAVHGCLDDGRADALRIALAAADLPERGNFAAAAIIDKEVAR